MESDDVYGREWHVILPVKWANIRDKPRMQFITEVPFVPETRFTQLPAPEVNDTDIKGNTWGGQSLYGYKLQGFISACSDHWTKHAPWYKTDGGEHI